MSTDSIQDLGELTLDSPEILELLPEDGKLDLRRRGVALGEPSPLVGEAIVAKFKSWTERFEALPEVLQPSMPTFNEVVDADNMYDAIVSRRLEGTLQMLREHLRLQVEKKALLAEYESAAGEMFIKLHQEKDERSAAYAKVFAAQGEAAPDFNAPGVSDLNHQLYLLKRVTQTRDAYDTKGDVFIKEAQVQLAQFAYMLAPRHLTKSAGVQWLSGSQRLPHGSTISG